MAVSAPKRMFAWHGVAAMLFGLSLIAIELCYGLSWASAGGAVRAVLLVLGTALSVYGLKEIIAGWWPGLRRRRYGPIVRHRFMLPLEGQIYAVIMMVLFAGSLLGHSNTLLLVFSMMAGPFVLNGAIVYSMLKRLRVRRSLPPRVMAGEPFSVEVTLQNPKRWLSVWLMAVRDQVYNARERLHPEVLFTRVPNRAERSGRYQLRLSQRGRYRFGPLQVNSRFPLGLVERGLVIAEPGEVLVYPRIGRLAEKWRRRSANATELVTDTQSHAGAFDDDFHRIREYRPGDDQRAIHWRTSARMSELMVREFRERRDRRLIVLFDAWQPARPSARDRDHFEYAVSLVATLALEQIRSSRGRHLILATNGQQRQLWGTGGQSSVESLLDLLALTEPNHHAGLDWLSQTARIHRTPQTRTIVVATSEERVRDIRWSARDESTGSIAIAERPHVIVASPEVLADMFVLE